MLIFNEEIGIWKSLHKDGFFQGLGSQEYHSGKSQVALFELGKTVGL